MEPTDLKAFAYLCVVMGHEFDTAHHVIIPFHCAEVHS